MDLYLFKTNGDKNNEEIRMVYINDDDLVSCKVGNIYNLVDYINYNIHGTARMEFINFTGNKLDFIVRAITRYKSIVGSIGYNSLIIKEKKKRVRGR